MDSQVNHKPDIFYRFLEEELPSKDLGIENEISEIDQLLRANKLKTRDFLEQANRIFAAVTERKPKEPRLDRMAIKLASKCFQDYSEDYFATISNTIEQALLDIDWEIAPWWQQIFHIFSLGFYRVDRVAKVDEISINLDFNDPLFHTHLIQFEFLPVEAFNSLGITEADNLKDYFKLHFNEISVLHNASSADEAEKRKVEEQEKLHNPQFQKVPTKKSNKVPKSASQDTGELLSTDTIVVNKTGANQGKEKTASSSPKNSESISPPTKTENASASKGELQHKKKSSRDEVVEARKFFALFKNLDENDPHAKKRSIRGVQKTLFRGEQKSISAVFKQSTTPEKPDELNLTTNSIN